MTHTYTRAGRSGFTLIELLVALAIIVTLSGFVLLVYPGARDQDRVRAALTEVGSTLKMAQGMAARDKSPRGVRFIVDATGKPNGDGRLSTELQFVELPPPLIPLRNPLTTGDPAKEPRVRFTYTVATGSATDNPPGGTITKRQCILENLSLEQVRQIVPGCTIVMPVFGSWHKITGLVAASNPPPDGIPSWVNETTALSGRYNGEVSLEVYPDANMGAGTSALVYHFAVYLTATPLVGEPTVLLPKDICVDLNAPDLTNANSALHIKVGSIGPPPNTTTDFDVIFAPDGKLVGNSTGQLFLWIRNYDKVPSMRIPDGLPLLTAFRRGGEQHIVTVRASGALGHSPAAWPDMATGLYATPQAPFALARQELNQ